INNENAAVEAVPAPKPAHVSEDRQVEASQVDGLEIAAADFVLPDDALRAKPSVATSANAIDAKAQLDVSADRAVVDAAAPAVSVQQLKRDTGFDGPIAVKANQQSWFQSAATVLAKVQMAASKDMRSGDVKSTLENSTVAQRMGNGLLVSGLERSVDQIAPYGQGASDDQTSGDPANGGPANGDAKAERAAFLIKGTSAVAEIETTAQTTIVATPYQQVRAAVVEAIAGTGLAQQTDYASLHADRPAGNTLTLKTLELSLSPPDLGRVNVRMNLTARDLTLELDASQASTAKLLSDDQLALKRDLLGDELDLSSVMVSVKNSVSEASSSSGLSNGDQQASGGSRSPSQDASASMAGGNRDERRSSQNSAYRDDNSVRDRADTQTSARGAERTASEIYI
ncbi:MAG TPA: flagellar hook-length control protein FliK, partial [Hyphomicrobium sp.]|nr:flagellar hook-length control protein FliK [Hyphomicrobium sp.]